MLHILDDEFHEVPNGTPGTIWFESPAGLNYWKDPEKTKEATSPDGRMNTTGDVGYVDDDGLAVPHRSQVVHDHLAAA